MSNKEVILSARDISVESQVRTRALNQALVNHFSRKFSQEC